MAGALPSYRLLGFKITPGTRHDFLNAIGTAIEQGRLRIIASQNLHGIYMFFSDEKFRALHEDARTLVHIDGTPILWLGRLLGLPLRSAHRTGWIDWFMLLMERAAREGWRVYYLGSEPQVFADGLARIRQACPRLAISGHHGFFDAEPTSQDNRLVLQEIERYRPHILIVGMGMKRQERWILDNLDRLDVNCIATTGACMELIAGTLSVPPRWMGPAGLEWLYRLYESPRRVAWRYLLEPWIVLWLIARHGLRAGVKRWE